MSMTIRSFSALPATEAAAYLLTHGINVRGQKMRRWIVRWIAAHPGEGPHTGRQELAHALLMEAASHGWGLCYLIPAARILERCGTGSVNLAGYRT